MKVYNYKIPGKVWATDVEEDVLEQFEHVCNLPFAFKHGALMPDAHQGYGMPIGGVLSTEGVVIPNAVGVDIGCGMRTARTDLQEWDTDGLKKVLRGIRETVPVGFRHNKFPDDNLPGRGLPLPIVKREYDKARYQLGTLGGGNHFIELQKDENGYLWIMIHSGSRNVGKQVADYYNKTAIILNERWRSSVSKEWQLAFLPLDTKDGELYIEEMDWCLTFARLNRKMMMGKVLNSLWAVYNCNHIEEHDVFHNYVALENHFGKNVYVHRKGATRARAGEIGIIPGSQGTCSYIVEGLGNPESFMSCSHGAGRAMSRKRARAELDLAEEKKRLDDKGVLHAIRGKDDLDEAASAYKDIDVVMENQKDLVKIIHKLEPLAVVKG